MDKKILLITGADGALGSKATEFFSGLGYKVVATYHPERPKPSLGVPCDLSKASSVQEVIQKAGPIGYWFHAAGGFVYSSIADLSEKDFDFLWSANTKSSFLVLKNLLPLWSKQNFGRAVLVSAHATQSPAGNGMGAYVASKVALNSLIQAATQETLDKNICLNAVMPTILDTPRNRADMASADFSKWVKLEDVLKTTEFLFSSSSLRGGFLSIRNQV